MLQQRVTCFQTTRKDQLPARGHWKAKEAAGQTQATLYGPDSTPKSRAKQTQKQDQWNRKWSVWCFYLLINLQAFSPFIHVFKVMC